jgi:hypothetical protein
MSDQAISVPGQPGAPVDASVGGMDSLLEDDSFSCGVSGPAPARSPVAGGHLPSPVTTRTARRTRREPRPESAQMAAGGLAGLGIILTVIIVGISCISGPGDIDEFGQNVRAASTRLRRS